MSMSSITAFIRAETAAPAVAPPSPLANIPLGHWSLTTARIRWSATRA